MCKDGTTDYLIKKTFYSGIWNPIPYPESPKLH